jgi:subtilisin family serine protease
MYNAYATLKLAAMLLLLVFLLLLLNGAVQAAPATPAPTMQLLLVTVADTAAPRAPQRGYHRPGYRLSPAAEQALSGLEQDYALTRVDGWPIHLLDVYCAVMAVAANTDPAATLERLSRDTRVSLAQRLQSFEVRGAYNDPYFALQYGRYAEQIERLHQRATGRGVRIAIIDTGIDRSHPDLRGRIGSARNFVDGDNEFDGDIHGTAVAGIIAAGANNNVGIVGMAPDAEILALRACWQLKAGEIAALCNSFTLAKALSFALEQASDIVNLSLSGPADPLLTQLLQLALRRDILVVAAQNQRGDFPANLPGVISVQAGISDGRLAWTVASGSSAVAADASELLSTSPGGHYDFFSGSSMAAARVTGLSALLRQGQQKLGSAQLLQNLNTLLNSPAAVAQLHY